MCRSWTRISTGVPAWRRPMPMWCSRLLWRRVTEPPVLHRIVRWSAGSPQYEIGHLDRVQAIEASLPAGLFVTGSPYRGVGIPDVVRAANGVAERIALEAPG